MTRRRDLTASLLILVMSACSAGGVPSPTTPADVFTIDSPRNGEAVGTESVEVSGTATAGAEVVRDVSFRPDQSATASEDGTWHMEVSLDEGRNELTFRLGDDELTEQELVVVYDPDLAVASESPTPRPTRSPSPSRAAATPTPVPSDGGGTAADAAAFARQVCAGTTYDNCVEGIVLVWEQAPGSLVAICEYEDGLGDIVLIDSEDDADDECSAGGLISPSAVFGVVDIPGS